MTALCSVAHQVAQQEAQRAQFVVEKARQERLQQIVQAEGEAASAKLVSLNSVLTWCTTNHSRTTSTTNCPFSRHESGVKC